jgi:putative nucleotidyltransferase with HDIG domain
VTRFGRLYIAAVGTAGVAALAFSFYALAERSFDYRVVLLGALTWISGSFSVRVPGLPATIYVSETFFFTLVLLFGPFPAAVCMAIDGLLISVRRRNREPHRVIFNIAEPTISVVVASTVFYALYGGPPLALDPRAISLSTAIPWTPSLIDVLLPATAMAGAYFLCNSWLMAFAVSSETRTPAYRVWREHFMWLSLNYFGGASVALLLALNWKSLDITLVLIVPLVVISYYTFKTSMERVEDANQHLTELNRLYLSTVETLAMAIDAKDQITHGHIRRVQMYATGLAKALGVTDTRELRAIEAAALLHDMGKLAVPEHILNKPGKLTAFEYDRMKTHASVGAQILSAIDFPYPVVPIVRHHHENWDGTGYPDGLSGKDIPIGARIMAVVDCYDALTSDRPYRPALSDEEALEIIEARKGTMYDPVVTDAFVAVHLEISSTVNATVQEVSHVQELLRPPSPAQPSIESASGGNREVSATLLALSDVAAQIGGHTTVEDLAVTLGSRVRQTVPCDVIVFYLRDSVSDDMVAAHAAGTGSEVFKGLRLKSGEGLSGWVAINKLTIMNSSGALDLADRCDRFPVALESALATPLCAGEEVVGVLTLYSAARNSFTTEHQQVVEFAARQIGPALGSALRFEQERLASLFDAETGLPNEKYLERVLASAMYCRRADSLRPGLLMLQTANGDGKPAPADLVLRLAATSRMAVRVTDLVFRTGNREFAVLMADTTADAMATVARRVTEAMGDAQADGQDTGVESAFALFPDHAAEPGDLLRAVRARSQQALHA